MKKQSGFAVLEILLVVVVVAAIGFAGVSYYNHTQTANNPSIASDVATASVPSAPEISTTADLTKAESMVDNMDLDASGNDSAQIDTEVSDF